MAATFFFYDLETTGIDSRTARIMQFAGQRVDMDLKPVGDPINAFVKLTPDVVPDPDAILITGITPQQTLIDGYTEAEFLKFFYDQVVQPETIFVGYNSVRFDDEFMRFLHYRNFYDPYEWQWQDGCTRWDLLDVVRMTRALRPEGIEWPFTDEGKPTNRLEKLTQANGLDHEHAHDALNDVLATIAVASLIKTKQPDMFDYLLSIRTKKKAVAVIRNPQPFIYSSGRYNATSFYTTVAAHIAEYPNKNCDLVYDLRVDPTAYIQMTVEELVAAWSLRGVDQPRFPVKKAKPNKCPAVAPIGVLKDPALQERLDITLETVTKHWNILKRHQKEFSKNILAAQEQMDDAYSVEANLVSQPVDERLYDNLFDSADKPVMRAVRAARGEELTVANFNFHDKRLPALLPLYKARNYPQTLTSEERAEWDAHCLDAVFAGGQNSKLGLYFKRLAELSVEGISEQQRYLIEELQLYGQSIVPADAAE